MANDETLMDAPLLPRLVVRVGGQVVQEVTLHDALSIGRAEDNDSKLTDPKASRHHARVQREGETFSLTDLGSANGTWVGGVRLVAAHTLRRGEPFSIGDTELTLVDKIEAIPETMPAPASIQAPLIVPPPPAPSGLSKKRGTNRSLTVSLFFVGAVLVLALVAVTLSLFAPGALQRIGLLRPPTPTEAAPSPTTTPPSVSETPTESPPSTALPTPVASPLAEEEFNNRLVEAEGLTLRSRFEEAIAIIESLTQSAPADARPEIGWAWALIYDDQADQALAHAQRAVELAPDSAGAVTVLARAYVEMGDRTQALAQAENAVQLAPGGAEAHAVLADAYRLNNQNEQAVGEADLALVQDNNSANARRARARLYQLVDNDLGRAVAELQGAAGLQPQLWLRRQELGQLLLDAQNYGTAVLAFQEALSLRPKAGTYAGLGEAYYGLEQYEQAAVSLRQAIVLGAEGAQTYALIAAADAHLARCDEARTYAQQALALDPAQPLALQAQDLCKGVGPSPQTTAGSPTVAPTPRRTPQPTRPPAALSGQIAFPVWNAQRGKYDTYVAAAKDGSGRRLVVEEVHQPALSPDGKWLAVNGERSERKNLLVVKADGSGLAEITANTEDGQPSWSPDGKKLAFASLRHGDKEWRIYIMDDVPLTGGTGGDRTLNYGPDDVRGQAPAWTSDGRIVYRGCALDSPRTECNGVGLFSMSAEPGPHKPTELTTIPGDAAPAVFGGKIAFMSNSDGNWEIYIVNGDGTGRKRLTNSPTTDDGLPVWSPDGETLAFVSSQGGSWAVWAMSPDGSNRRKLFDIGGGGLSPNWQQERISWGP